MNSKVVQDRFGRDSGCWKAWRAFASWTGPASEGVYAFRVAGGLEIGRVVGASDIIYVGHGKIQDRLTAHAKPDWENWNDSGWLICFISQARALEVAWVEMPAGEASSLESALLEKYLLDHRELPPANRRLEGISKRTKAYLAVGSFPPEDRVQMIGKELKRRTQ